MRARCGGPVRARRTARRASGAYEENEHYLHDTYGRLEAASRP
ncbi:Hypothetical protein SCLAV_p0363 (plasmid) [Streptomyces clavuligerus]|uniref:Uncharacterized protein n=1 Tax=Streptomyces clavuligerus TaxID=1901 RepID=B5GS62_STRCL|nr:hypothetical protein SSCG_02186 [Streptomyces clavuligerus]EFG03853.1 Hypothetical protein SCLAV_p0363 [Streptomyces clavuligerus]